MPKIKCHIFKSSTRYCLSICGCTKCQRISKFKSIKNIIFWNIQINFLQGQYNTFMNFRPSDNFSSSRSSEQRLSDEQYQVLSCNHQLQTFDQQIQTDFPVELYSIDEMFSQNQPQCVSIGVQATQVNYQEILEQMKKLGEANKQLAMRNIELEGYIEQSKEKLRKYNMMSMNQNSKENELFSLKQVADSYRNQQKAILQFMVKNLGITSNNFNNKSLKSVIQSVFVQFSQNLQQISRQLTLIRAMSSEETLGQVQPHKKIYNHWGQLRKITQIKENVIKLHHRSQSKIK